MVADSDQLKAIPTQSPVSRSRTLLTGGRLALLALAGTSILCGLALPMVPDKFQLPLVALVPAVIVGLYILKSPFFGVYMFYLYEYLRPYDFIPALRPLRLAMLIEIVTLASWALYMLRKRVPLKWVPFNWASLGFLAVIGLSVIFAANNFYAYKVFKLMAITLVMYLIATNVVNSIKRLESLLWMLLLVHIYFSIHGIYNFAIIGYTSAGQNTSGVVGSSFIGDENDFALALNTMIPFAYFMATWVKKMWKKLVSASALFLLVLGVASSFSRGGWVGLVAVIIFCILNSRRKLSALAYTGLLATALLAFAPSSYWTEMETISDTSESTANARLEYWETAIRMYADHPVFGVGAGNGGVWMPAYFTGAGDANRQWGRAFHGTIPQMLAETGTVGAVCYFAMLILAIGYLLKVKRRYKRPDSNQLPVVLAKSLLGGIVGYMACAIFLSTVYYPQLWTLYMLTVTLFLVCSSGNESGLTLDGLAPEALRPTVAQAAKRTR